MSDPTVFSIRLTAICREWNQPQSLSQEATLHLHETTIRILSPEGQLVVEFPYQPGRTSISYNYEFGHERASNFKIPFDHSGYTYVVFDLNSEDAVHLSSLLYSGECSCGDDTNSDSDSD
jgi:hypothetical protein